ncbi:MAG: radical SAM protein, partial [Oligoflexia bacterium]|nr:radical SAM protein [Oligoflexia bacterium]
DQIFNKLTPGLKKISFDGIGEPLLNNHLCYFIEKSSRAGIYTHTTTNGMLLTKDILQSLKSAGLKNLNISIDAPCAEVYEKIRQGANFDKLRKNLRFIRETNFDSFCEVVVWFVGAAENLHLFPSMVDFVKSFGIKKLVMQVEQSWGKVFWEKIGKENPRVNEDPDKDFLKKIIHEAKDRGKKSGVTVSYVNVPDVSSARACKWPWKGFYISVDGYITPCCIHGTNPQILNFGNIFNEEIDLILNNEKYVKFRGDLKSKKIPKFCQGCTGYFKPLKI